MTDLPPSCVPQYPNRSIPMADPMFVLQQVAPRSQAATINPIATPDDDFLARFDLAMRQQVDAVLANMRAEGFYLTGTLHYDATTYDINCGGCEEFATDVMDVLGGKSDTMYGVWLEDLADDGPNHFVIVLNGRYHDAECIDGVDDWRELPVYMNRKKKRARVLAERAKVSA